MAAVENWACVGSIVTAFVGPRAAANGPAPAERKSRLIFRLGAMRGRGRDSGEIGGK